MIIEVILPTYKPGHWVKEAIKSVVEQTCEDWHLTIIDDASPDDSVQKIKEFLDEFPEEVQKKIKVIELEQNLGAAGARNHVAETTSAQYLCFLDQDDRYKKDKLEKQVEKLEESDADLVHANIAKIDGKGKVIGVGESNKLRNKIGYLNLSNNELQEELFQTNSIRIGTVMIDRKSFLEAGGFDESLFGGEDWEFWVRFSAKNNISHLGDILYEKRVHPQQVSSRHSKERIYGKLKAVDKIERNFDSLSDIACYKRQHFVRKIAKQEILDGNDGKAREVIKENLENRLKIKDWLLNILTYMPLNKYILKSYLH